MSLKIHRVAVLGAGVMGAQIAAHLAAAGVRTHLLDLPSEAPHKDPKIAAAIGKGFRSTAAYLAIENLKKLKPSPLASESILANLIPGNFADDMSVIADCDWVIEVVAEKLEIKKSILKQISEYARPHIPVTTNTSGLSLEKMSEDLDENFHSRFFGTHFFNPPRYMKLLEIIPHTRTDPKLIKDLTDWIERYLGKGIVYAKDTINFIANRVGTFSITSAFVHMEALDLNVETVDALSGKTVGRPSSASFRTMDVVGIDVFAAVAKNVGKYAPNDPYVSVFTPPKWIDELISRGSLGQKTKSVGIYKKETDAKGASTILAYRPKEDKYVEQAPETFPWQEEAKKIPDTIERIRFIISHSDKGAKFIWLTLRDTMAYSAILLEEIANNQPLSIDNAIKWGFNWEWGPFELWQALGYDTIRDRMIQEGVKLPDWIKPGVQFYKTVPNSLDWHINGPRSQLLGKTGKDLPVIRSEHSFYLPKSKNAVDKRSLVLGNGSASLVDIGDGVAALTFHSKMNSINDEIIEIFQASLAKVKTDFAGLVIANDGEVFSAGADLKQILGAIKDNKFDAIDNLLRRFQGTMQALKYATFPSIACPHGLTLGGGCEVSLHASEQIIAGDTFAGLVEVGVGLIPGGGGTKELALRAYAQAALGENADPMPFLQKAFLLIGMGKTSTSGLEAVEMGLYNHAKATVTLARDFQVLRAKKRILQLVENGYQPPVPQSKIKVVGDAGIQTFNMAMINMVQGRQISPYDALVGEKVVTVLCGGEIDAGQFVSEEYFLDLERRVFLELCHETKTQERIEAMLKTGKPLRN
ncbi:MAG: 3-hydroxyacyl-CoA dehydrogenase/enoyl-CoA hydratase family protein [Proteobacteria bacterium]|nr:MAG: 3-hydroxyacyl-CoA dehydrogenase/enoyl-CoA hydratase family protein [Pseudomonadota bacterium]